MEALVGLSRAARRKKVKDNFGLIYINMIKTIKSEKIPIKLWLEDIDLEALKQAKNLANFPFAFHHIAIMPDAHVGYGMPIGGIIATHDVVIPNAVGVDIGCGMCAVKTSLTEIDIKTLKKIMGQIRESVPLGFKHHKESQNKDWMPKESIIDLKIIREEYDSAKHQVGTLGGGNHFIEIQRDSEGFIWLMVHSGSRNLGKKVADYYNRLAKEKNKWEKPQVPPEWDLAYLKIESKEGQSYLREMDFCLKFARLNRFLMLERIKNAYTAVIKNIKFEEPINIHHNYANLEEHFGEKVWIHRKGATSARKSEIGIIPGSQGTKSYIVEGKGNPESFMSCSHGSGRIMGRNEAVRTLDLRKEIEKLEGQGILHAIHGRRDLEEAAGAYKDIEIVIKNQEDLVEIISVLKPLAVIKG